MQIHRVEAQLRRRLPGVLRQAHARAARQLGRRRPGEARPGLQGGGNLVKVVVGSVPHPMEDDHYIEWIYLLTDKGAQIKYLHPHDAPAAEFALSEDEVAIAVYAYCNKHGLWKADIE